MKTEVLSRVLKNGYKVVTETVRGKMGGNPKDEINTVISVFDDLGNLLVRRDKTVHKNSFGNFIDYCAGKIPKDYHGATTLFSETYYPTNNALGGITVAKEVNNYSGLLKKISGSVDIPGHGKANWGQTHVRQNLKTELTLTDKEFRRYIHTKANGEKFSTEHYPQFLKDMIEEYGAKI